MGERFEDTVNKETGELKVEPYTLDGLSFPMTLVWLIAMIRFYAKKKLNLVIMGATGKVEERLFLKTNYYEELTNFYPEMMINIYFVGPELSKSMHGSTV